MKTSLRVLLILVFLGLLTGSAFARQGDDLPPLTALPAASWTQIVPGGDTGCMYGDEFSFFVRPAEQPSGKLMIYFQGGGACWDGFTCGAKGRFASEYDVSPDEADRHTAGIFDFANEANPVRDFDAVFVPYCTGDVHAGDAEVTFDVPKEDLGVDVDTITVQFNGYNNAMAVLDWVYANFAAPSQIFVAGTSAGGYGATRYAPYVMHHYSDVPTVLLADAANGVLPDDWTGFEVWHGLENQPDFLDLGDLKTSTYVTNYQTAAIKAFPQNTFAQYNTFLDMLQIGFYGVMTGRDVTTGEDAFRAVAEEWSPALVLNLAKLGLAGKNFTHYLAGGLEHGVLPSDLFYTYTVDGLTVAAWTAGLLAGDLQRPMCDMATDECFTEPIPAP